LEIGEGIYVVGAIPTATWCGGTLLRTGPDKALLKQHRLDGGRLAWVGYSSSGAKLDALEDFEKQGSSVGSGLATKNGFFWVVRKGGSRVVRLADAQSAQQLAACSVWPVGAGTVGNQLFLEFVGTAEDSLWQILQCWVPLLSRWGIRKFHFELHAEADAWEQLDVEPAFLHFGSEDLRRFREGRRVIGLGIRGRAEWWMVFLPGARLADGRAGCTEFVLRLCGSRNFQAGAGKVRCCLRILS
jgi:hypothetical protein